MVFALRGKEVFSLKHRSMVFVGDELLMEQELTLVRKCLFYEVDAAVKTALSPGSAN